MRLHLETVVHLEVRLERHRSFATRSDEEEVELDYCLGPKTVLAQGRECLDVHRQLLRKDGR